MCHWRKFPGERYTNRLSWACTKLCVTGLRCSFLRTNMRSVFLQMHKSTSGRQKPPRPAQTAHRPTSESNFLDLWSFWKDDFQEPSWIVRHMKKKHSKYSSSLTAWTISYPPLSRCTSLQTIQICYSCLHQWACVQIHKGMYWPKFVDGRSVWRNFNFPLNTFMERIIFVPIC